MADSDWGNTSSNTYSDSPSSKTDPFPESTGGTYSAQVAFYLIFWEEITKLQKTNLNFLCDGTALEKKKGNKIKVKLRNGSEIYANSGNFRMIESGAWVAMLKHFRPGSGKYTGMSDAKPESYEVIGVRYKTEKGTLSKTYRV